MPQVVVACSQPLCPRPAVDRGRCAVHRRSTSQRGYGRPHQLAHDELARTLPAPCGYCRRVIQRGERWVAAHRVDGQPEHGYVVAHPACNERAKGSPLPPAGRLV